MVQIRRCYTYEIEFQEMTKLVDHLDLILCGGRLKPFKTNHTGRFRTNLTNFAKVKYALFGASRNLDIKIMDLRYRREFMYS